MLRKAERPPRSPQKAGLLRVLKALAAIARYCGRNAGSLFLLVWFPCLMVAVSQIALDWLSLSFPPKLPSWLLSQSFNPPTWLTATALTPWGAMAWAFVLADMSNRKTRRGVTSVLQSLRARFELSLAVLVAAMIFTAVNLIDGGLRTLQLPLLAKIAERFELSDELFGAIGKTGEIMQVIVMAAVVAAAYLTIGSLLRSGFRSALSVWRVTRHNRLRVFALFLLLSLISVALNAAAAPVISLVFRSFADDLFWTPQGALVRQLVDLPFFMLWTVVYAVTVGIVLGALEQRSAAQAPAPKAPASKTPAPSPKAAAAPPPRPGGSRPW
jgi:hypothetical protein